MSRELRADAEDRRWSKPYCFELKAALYRDARYSEYSLHIP